MAHRQRFLEEDAGAYEIAFRGAEVRELDSRTRRAIDLDEALERGGEQLGPALGAAGLDEQTERRGITGRGQRLAFGCGVAGAA